MLFHRVDNVTIKKSVIGELLEKKKMSDIINTVFRTVSRTI